MNVKRLKDYYEAVNNLSMDSTGMVPTAENLCSEIYNKSNEEITFTTYHPEWKKHFFFGLPPKNWFMLKCKPGEWVFLPHSMYIATVPSGSQEIPVIQNFGEMMFQGNKLPSRPEAAKTRVFVKR